jgi:hypothetical protein
VSVEAPFVAAGDHFAIDLPGGRALFSSRHGGVSEGPYRSLNLGASGVAHEVARPPAAGSPGADDPRRVRQNRDRLAAAAGLAPASLAHSRQVHGASVATRRRSDGLGAAGEADGQLTSDPGVGVLVLVADCLPIALVGEGGVAALHAGWRGLRAGVVANGVLALRERSGGPLRAAIGPGAGPCCYEVGEEVHEQFADVAGASRGRHLDLRAIARDRLERAGVAEIHDLGLCTICDERFFSHRRDQGRTGRQGGVVWRA